MNPDPPNPQGCKPPESRYANHFMVGYNALEFLIDFSQQYQGCEAAPTHTRIVTNPVYAKELLKTLQAAIDQYEQTYGLMPEPDSTEQDRGT